MTASAPVAAPIVIAQAVRVVPDAQVVSWVMVAQPLEASQALALEVQAVPRAVVTEQPTSAMPPLM
jgi:hypothetical protein